MAAPEGNKNALGNKSALLFKEEFSEQVYKLCLLGATDKEIADFFAVSKSTINNWKRAFPDFTAAMKRGKMMADANVAERLYQRAMGFEHDSEEIKILGDKVERVPIRKVYAPDTMAAIYWLNNRQKLNWKQKQTLEHSFDPEKMTDDQLEKIIEELKKSIK